MDTEAQTSEAKANRIIELMATKPQIAHEVFFAKRHPNKTPYFHDELIASFWSPTKYEVLEAFRGGAKSSRAEEFMALGAALRGFKYALIVADNYDLACKRLAAIRHELETNEDILALVGDMKGPTWGEGKIVLGNDVCIEAYGAGMSMRGAKHHDDRPDFCLFDDLEEYEGIVDVKRAVEHLFEWVLRVVIPALDPTQHRVRMVGTPLLEDCVLRKFAKLSGWTHRKFPIEYLDVNTGERVATWPDRFPLAWIDAKRAEFEEAGKLGIFMQEYMLVAEEKAMKPFDTTKIIVQPATQARLPVYAFLDPARTTNIQTSARSGFAVWSWIGPRLLIHEAFGAYMKPDQQIAKIFEIDEKYQPIVFGVERDGLEEFIFQPIRAEMVRRGKIVPIEPVKAPVNKLGFIQGLQPFVNAGDVTVAEGLCKDAVEEFKSFPIGLMDVINALAFAPRMRPGQPVYEDFGLHHIGDNLQLNRTVTPYVCVSGSMTRTTAVLAQYDQGRLSVVGSWIEERPPLECLENMLTQIAVEVRRPFALIAPAEQFDKFGNSGVVAACRRARHDISRGQSTDAARGSLVSFLRGTVRGMPAFAVDEKARWVINGLSGGYARPLKAGEPIPDEPVSNMYRPLLEGLEVFARFLRVTTTSGVDSSDKWTTDSRGQLHMSLLRGSKRG